MCSRRETLSSTTDYMQIVVDESKKHTISKASSGQQIAALSGPWAKFHGIIANRVNGAEA